MSEQLPDGQPSMEEWFRLLPSELEVDAISLRPIINAGRARYDLSGDDLVKFVERAIRVLLSAGAVACAPGTGDMEWTPSDKFGTNLDEVVTNILREWVLLGADPDWDFVWFNRFN